MYGPVRTVVWEDGGREAPSYPIEGAFITGTSVFAYDLAPTPRMRFLSRSASGEESPSSPPLDFATAGWVHWQQSLYSDDFL